ncbi:MAG: hypothetical protein BGO26_09245 [Actinobacteria bacterium 69-20]|nr:MAG: hypothetical protein BGO26_09245 [Actinobacteria bacterium 69-20]
METTRSGGAHPEMCAAAVDIGAIGAAAGFAAAPCGDQPRLTLPALMQEVHALILRTVPGATWARTA